MKGNIEIKWFFAIVVLLSGCVFRTWQGRKVMKFGYLAGIAVLMFCGAGFAAEESVAVSSEAAVAASTAAPARFSADKLSATDGIERGIMDLEALYWAWRIAEVKDVAYDGIDAYARNWPVKPGTRAQILKKIKAHLDAGTARALTAGETRRYNDAKTAPRAVLFDGGK
ncbi:MAG: hypothetical protein PHW69_08490 [Elusimicrobiaceae bacterium]|nr:hypothetical protein [Elusimicrobiaceae bacterium]